MSLSRKVQEAFLALQLERKLTKRQILAAYLNSVFSGSEAYGAEAAARTYFGKSAARLSLKEAALVPGSRRRLRSTTRAGAVTDALEGVVRKGTGTAAALDRPAAGKTGSWPVVFGGSIPARIWHNFMAVALAGSPVLPLND